MNKTIKLVVALLVATTVPQLHGMGRFSQAFARARVAMASPLASMRVAASRWMPKIGITAASPAKVMAAKLWHNKGRVALGTAAVGVATQATPKAKAADWESAPEAQSKTPFADAAKRWDTEAPSLAQSNFFASCIRPCFTVAHLKREVDTNYKHQLQEEYGRPIWKDHVWHVAPLSLKIALQKLTPEAEQAINEYHQETIANTSSEKRAKLRRNVELLVRDEDARTEILDNLRWLQNDSRIGRAEYSRYNGAIALANLGTTAFGYISFPISAALLGFEVAYNAEQKSLRLQHARNWDKKHASQFDPRFTK